MQFTFHMHISTHVLDIYLRPSAQTINRLIDQPGSSGGRIARQVSDPRTRHTVKQTKPCLILTPSCGQRSSRPHPLLLYAIYGNGKLLRTLLVYSKTSPTFDQLPAAPVSCIHSIRESRPAVLGSCLSYLWTISQRALISVLAQLLATSSQYQLRASPALLHDSREFYGLFNINII